MALGAQLCATCVHPQSCPTLCDPKDCSPPASSVHGILQGRTLEWVALPSSRRSSWPRNWTQVSRIAGRFFTNWATRGSYSTQLCKFGKNHWIEPWQQVNSDRSSMSQKLALLSFFAFLKNTFLTLKAKIIYVYVHKCSTNHGYMGITQWKIQRQVPPFLKK